MFRETVRDGVIDIMIGCFFLMFVFAPLLSVRIGDFWSSAIFLPFWLVIYLGLRFIRKNLILPRIGKIEFSDYRKKRLMNINLVFLVFNLIALGLGVVAYFNIDKFQGIIPFSILMLLGFSLGGYMIESPRLYIYGFLAMLAPLVGEYLWNNHGFSHHGFPVTFGVLAVGVIMTGLVLMLSIFRRYPLPEDKDLEW
jgi:hypothetical protein